MNSRVNSRDFRLTITWCSCWPYGIAPRAEVNFSAPCAVSLRWTAARWPTPGSSVNPGFFCQPLLSSSYQANPLKNPLGSNADSHVSPLARHHGRVILAAKALSTRKGCRYCGCEVSIVLALEDTPFCALKLFEKLAGYRSR